MAVAREAAVAERKGTDAVIHPESINGASCPTKSDAPQETVARRSWSYLRTPITVFLFVMAPINILMFFLIVTSTPTWMKITSGGVILLTIATLVRGYWRRLVLTAEGPVLIRPFAGRILIPWPEVRRIDAMVPGGGAGGTAYLYVTRRDEPPAGAWDVDAETIQIQNREGVLDVVLAAWKESKPGSTDMNGAGSQSRPRAPAESRPATPP